MKYKHAILGGTFDHLHEGHAHFISAAFSNSERVTIGLATDQLSKNKPLSSSIKPYKERLAELKKYLSVNSFSDRVSIIQINDIFGNSLEEKDIDAIFVTSHGLPSARIINTKREKLGFSKLSINKVSFFKDEDGKIISSTRIRKGEIDRTGFSYLKLFSAKLFLKENLRRDLQILDKPIKFGQFSPRDYPFVISVGDVTTENLLRSGFKPGISIIDFKTRRIIIDAGNVKFDADNSSGEINPPAVQVLNVKIKEMINRKKVSLKINGEEDLMVLPAIMLAPLGTCVVYGLVTGEIVPVRVTEIKKEEIKKLVLKFNRTVK